MSSPLILAFDPGVDQLNQHENKPEEIRPAPAKKDPARRFQAASLEAPLSNRQKKKRKQEHKSYEPQTTTGDVKAGSS